MALGPWLVLGLALAGAWPGPWPGPGWPLAWPWLALGQALGWPGSDRFQFKPVLVQTSSGSDWFDSSGSGSILSLPEI